MQLNSDINILGLSFEGKDPRRLERDGYKHRTHEVLRFSIAVENLGPTR